MGRRPGEAFRGPSRGVRVACKHTAPKSRERLGNPNQSPAWKLTLCLPLADILREQQERNGLQIEPITLDDILALSNLPSIHRDPFDRMLVVQSRRGDFRLTTRDADLARYGVAMLW
jgi:hypothetical protein